MILVKYLFLIGCKPISRGGFPNNYASVILTQLLCVKLITEGVKMLQKLMTLYVNDPFTD